MVLTAAPVKNKLCSEGHQKAASIPARIHPREVFALRHVPPPPFSSDQGSGMVTGTLRTHSSVMLWGAAGFLLSGLFFAPASKIRRYPKIKNGDPEMISVPAHPRHKWKVAKLFLLIRKGKQPKHKVLGQDIPGTSGTQTSGYPGQKLYARGLFLLF